jgi:hypothetical protein
LTLAVEFDTTPRIGAEKRTILSRFPGTFDYWKNPIATKTRASTRDTPRGYRGQSSAVVGRTVAPKRQLTQTQLLDAPGWIRSRPEPAAEQRLWHPELPGANLWRRTAPTVPMLDEPPCPINRPERRHENDVTDTKRVTTAIA